MKKTAILSLSESKRMFKPAYIVRECGDMPLLTVQNRLRAINKLKKHYRENNLLISHGDENKKIFKSICKIKKGVSYGTVLPILEKICRQTAQKYNIQIPFREVYLMASPYIACAITACLSGISKIFTVVSEESPLTNSYDELYFKHGTIIRHLPEFNNNISEDSVIIRCSADELPSWAKIPVIDFTEGTSCSNLVIRIENICVSDEQISASAKLWGGKSGLEFYELMGKIPTVDALVNINIMADKIFLLDTEGF